MAWTVTHQALLSMGFSKQESWSELPCPSPGDLPDPGIKPGSPPSLIPSSEFQYYFISPLVSCHLFSNNLCTHSPCRRWWWCGHPIVSDSVTPWTVAHQAPLSMEFSTQESWSVLSCPPPGDLPNPGIEPCSTAMQGDSLPSEPSGRMRGGG